MMTKYLYIVSALMLGMFGCSQDDQNVQFSHSDTMSFNIVSPNGESRVADGEFQADDKLGIYVTDYIDDTTASPIQISGNHTNNQTMVFNGTTWATERPIYWGEGKSDVYAYYPYMDIEDVDEQPFSVATDQTLPQAYEASDFLWAKATGVAQTDGTVLLEMQHTMSRLVVKIMAGEDYVGSLPKDATVHLHSTVTDAHISLANGSVVKDPYGGAHSIKMRNLGIRSFADGDAVVFEAVVVPQMLETSVPLLEINSKSVSYLLEDMFNFKPGVSYTYTAVLNTSTTAIKIDIGCSTDDWNNLGGDTGGDGDDSEGGEDDGIDLSAYTDLCTKGTANCYLIQGSGNYKLKAVMGNSDYTVGNVKRAEVLWESFGTDVVPNVGDLVTNVGYKSGYVYFSTPQEFKNGNALIAVRNSKGVILWSWHIWCSEEGWNDQVYPNNAGVMMDRNLGATSAVPGNVGALGLLYQWGRKDPFMGPSGIYSTTLAASTGSWSVAPSYDNSMDYAEENPMTFLTGWYGASTWHTSESKKSIYDPSPVGYRVPDGGDNGFWATALGTSSIKGDYENNGLYWTLADGVSTAWYPAVGCRNNDSGALSSVGSNGYCWSASPDPSYGNIAYRLSFNNDDYGNVHPAISSNYYFSSISGCSVRCVRE